MDYLPDSVKSQAFVKDVITPSTLRADGQTLKEKRRDRDIEGLNVAYFPIGLRLSTAASLSLCTNASRPATSASAVIRHRHLRFACSAVETHLRRSHLFQRTLRTRHRLPDVISFDCALKALG
jgi:hypothetical protein